MNVTLHYFARIRISKDVEVILALRVSRKYLLIGYTLAPRRGLGLSELAT